MKAEVGKYKFSKRRCYWIIWQCVSANESTATLVKVKNVYSYEEAVSETYRLNGWAEPRYIKRVF